MALLAVFGSVRGQDEEAGLVPVQEAEAVSPLLHLQ
jgi:hypothetical protein